MARSTGIPCVRFTLLAFNFITLMAGVATFAVGVMLLLSSTDDKEATTIGLLLKEEARNEEPPTNREFKGLSFILMILGGLVSVISFLGCFGACVRGKCLLASYLILLGMILMLQFLVSVFAIWYRQPMSRTLRNELMHHIRRDYRPGTDIDRTWGMAHQMFQCCGVDSYSDWFEIDAWPHDKFVPDSCCLDATNMTGCGSQELNPNLWHKQGCLGKIQLVLMEKLHYLASAIIILVFLQLYGIVASTLLFFHVKEPKTELKPYTNSYSYELANRGSSR